MGIADFVIIIILVICLGIAGYFAFSGKGHGSCCDEGKNHKKSGCDGDCANCKRHM